MKNQIMQTFKSFKILKEKVVRQKTRFFLPFGKNICSMGSKCIALGLGYMYMK